MNAADTGPVADIFAESDTTELPLMLGASRRTLFHYRGLYLHLIEADEDFTDKLDEAGGHELFNAVNAKLSRYISPYDPSWRKPRDAMADSFYTWARPS
jgi:cyclase